jgi:hypothetical protein
MQRSRETFKSNLYVAVGCTSVGFCSRIQLAYTTCRLVDFFVHSNSLVLVFLLPFKLSIFHDFLFLLSIRINLMGWFFFLCKLDRILHNLKLQTQSRKNLILVVCTDSIISNNSLFLCPASAARRLWLNTIWTWFFFE